MDANESLQVILVLVAVFLIAPLVGAAALLPALFGLGHGGMMGGSMALWWLVSGLVPLVIVVGTGYALYSVLQSDGGRTDPAIAELRAAYARGDITDEEFEARYERLQRTDGRDGE